MNLPDTRFTLAAPSDPLLKVLAKDPAWWQLTLIGGGIGFALGTCIGSLLGALCRQALKWLAGYYAR